MTVADNTSRNQYTATSGQTVFAYTFEIVDKSHIVVLKNGTKLSEGTNYTVSNVGNDSGGNITLTEGATTGDIMTFYRDMPYSRTQNYTNSGDFLASEVNSDFDDLWLAGEQTDRSFSQSIRKPIVDSDSVSMELPTAPYRANKLLGFTSTGAVVAYESTAISTGLYPRTSNEVAAGVTPSNYSLPEGHVDRYGGTADNSADNYDAITKAVSVCKGNGVTLKFGDGTYYVQFTTGTNNKISVIDALVVEGTGSDTTSLRYGPNDASFDIDGWKPEGVDFTIRDLTIIPPGISNIASKAFDDLKRINAITVKFSNSSDVSQNCQGLIERVKTTQGFETAVQGLGAGNAGWKLFIKECELYAYSVPVAVSNSDDAVANEALRELWIHNCTFYGHNNEGPDWTTRGRIIYVHPHISVDYDNISCYGSGRVQVAQYSSGGIPWNAHPPRYLNFRNIRLNKLDGGAYTEGFQTSNLVGCVSYYENCKVDVIGQCRVRHNAVFKGCHITGISKEFTSQDGALKTFMAVAGSATNTTITVIDASIFSSGDSISIWLDNNTLHTTTVNGAPSGNVITLAAALPSGVAVNRWVVKQIFGGTSGDTTEWVKWIGCTFDNDPFPGAMIAGVDRVDHYFEDNTVTINNLQGGDTDFYHSNSANAGTLYSKDNTYRFVGGNTGHAIESENTGATFHFDGDVFEGNSKDSAMLIGNVGSLGMINCVSYLDEDAAGGSFFMSGAGVVNTIYGNNNKFYGTAKPKLTTAQRLEPGCGVNPSNVTNAATLVLDMNYDMHRVSGTGTVTNILHENDATIDAMICGKVTLISLNGMTLTHGGRLYMPGGVNKVLAANESFTLFFDGINNKVHGIS